MNFPFSRIRGTTPSSKHICSEMFLSGPAVFLIHDVAKVFDTVVVSYNGALSCLQVAEVADEYMLLTCCRI